MNANGNAVRVNAYGIRQSMARPVARPAVKRAVAVYSAPDYMLAVKVGAAIAAGFVSVAAILIF